MHTSFSYILTLKLKWLASILLKMTTPATHQWRLIDGLSPAALVRSWVLRWCQFDTLHLLLVLLLLRRRIPVRLKSIWRQKLKGTILDLDKRSRYRRDVTNSELGRGLLVFFKTLLLVGSLKHIFLLQKFTELNINCTHPEK